MNIIYKSIDELIPYANNPRKNDNAVEAVANSIYQFGWKQPVVIDCGGVIVAGHTRVKAAKKLGITQIPCLIADDLTEEQIKAFRLADNSTAELAEWNFELLESEMIEIDEIDMCDFGFEFEELNQDSSMTMQNNSEKYYGDERERTYDAYNLSLIDCLQLDNDWQMPIIKKTEFVPNDLIGFNYAKTSDQKESGIHCYIDDYQFERLWNTPEKYIEVLAKYSCFLSPDFSLYMDMPMPVKIWNIFRSRFIGAYYQNKGIEVIPTLSWAEPATFAFCFKGIEKGGVVSVSTIGVKNDTNALKIWHDGMNEMIKQIEPSTIIVYGGKIDFDYKGIREVYFENKVIDNLRLRG